MIIERIITAVLASILIFFVVRYFHLLWIEVKSISDSLNVDGEQIQDKQDVQA